MSVRLSFGSRAGGTSDYQGGSNGHLGFFSRGPFDSLDALADALKAEIEAAANSSVPECTTAELSLSVNALLTLNRPGIGPYAEGGDQDLPPEFKSTITAEDGTVKPDPFPKATAEAIINVPDSRQRQIVQRAASRGIIQAIESTDGFRYSFNNAWTAKDEEGSRFSYICQDSMQNKDRHANGFARTLKHLKGEGERGPRKPTYDCKGSVSVKFSSGRQRVDVYYRHYAIHQTVAERKPPPRPAPRQKAPKQPAEQGGLRETLAQTESYANSALAMVGNSSPANDSPLAGKSESSNIGRPLKRKREMMMPPPTTPAPPDPNRSLSLMELLKQSETANAPPPQSEAPKPGGKQSNAPPVNYELPSWQTPPPPLTQPSRNGQYPAPYPPPYNPTRSRPLTHTPTATNGQSLFTTMKASSAKGAAHKEYLIQTPQTYGTPQAPGFREHPRAKQSCTNCRMKKQKCDEGRPCAACQKSGRTNCVYDSNPTQQPQQQQQQGSEELRPFLKQTGQNPMPGQSSWGTLSQSPAPQQYSQWQNQSQYPMPSGNGSQQTPASQNTPDLPWPNTMMNSNTLTTGRESPDP